MQRRAGTPWAAPFPGGVTIFLGTNPNLAGRIPTTPTSLDVCSGDAPPKRSCTLRREVEPLHPYPKSAGEDPGVPSPGVKQHFYKANTASPSKRPMVTSPCASRQPRHSGAMEQWYRMNKATNLKEFPGSLAPGRVSPAPILSTPTKGRAHFYISNGGFSRSAARGIAARLAGPPAWTPPPPFGRTIYYPPRQPRPRCWTHVSGYVYNCNHIALPRPARRITPTRVRSREHGIPGMDYSDQPAAASAWATCWSSRAAEL